MVGVLGARQVGKSTLLREIIGKDSNIPYFTLDRPEVLRQIRSRAESFILTETNEFKSPVIIDEAHKAPKLFDVLKVLSDERKNRGIVTITGSVDFSMASGVRETLTGRIGICKLFPMTVSETRKKKFFTRWKSDLLKDSSGEITSANVETWIERGGMPGICRLGDEAERVAMIEEWLQSICNRDLLQLKGSRYDGALAREILALISKNPELTAARIASELGIDSRVVSKHLLGLESLYVVNRVRPLRSLSGAGFDRFYVLDSAIAAHLGASRKTLYTVLMINELLAQHEYSGAARPELYYYASRGATRLDLAIKSRENYYGFFISDRAEQSSYTIRSLEAAGEKKFFHKIAVLAPVTGEVKLGRHITLEPYARYC